MFYHGVPDSLMTQGSVRNVELEGRVQDCDAESQTEGIPGKHQQYHFCKRLS